MKLYSKREDELFDQVTEAVRKKKQLGKLISEEQMRASCGDKKAITRWQALQTEREAICKQIEILGRMKARERERAKHERIVTIEEVFVQIVRRQISDDQFNDWWSLAKTEFLRTAGIDELSETLPD